MQPLPAKQVNWRRAKRTRESSFTRCGSVSRPYHRRLTTAPPTPARHYNWRKGSNSSGNVHILTIGRRELAGGVAGLNGDRRSRTKRIRDRVFSPFIPLRLLTRKSSSRLDSPKAGASRLFHSPIYPAKSGNHFGKRDTAHIVAQLSFAQLPKSQRPQKPLPVPRLSFVAEPTGNMSFLI
jgi:hypothetical protein